MNLTLIRVLVVGLTMLPVYAQESQTPQDDKLQATRPSNEDAEAEAATNSPFAVIRKAIIAGEMKDIETVASSKPFSDLFQKLPVRRELGKELLKASHEKSVLLMKATDTNASDVEMSESQLSTFLAVQLFEAACSTSNGGLNEKLFAQEGEVRDTFKHIAGQFCLVHITSVPANCKISIRRSDSKNYKELEKPTNTVYGVRYGDYEFRCTVDGKSHEKSVSCMQEKVPLTFP